MNAVVNCLTQQHDLPLVGLAALLCTLGICAAFGLATEGARTDDRRRRNLWNGAAVVSLASAIWATHFVAMLAYRPGMTATFGLPLTALSYVVAIAIVGIGGFVMAESGKLAGRVFGGAVIGLSISAMHYTGMAAYHVQGVVDWDFASVAASVTAGAALAAAAAFVAYRPGRLPAAAAPVLMILAVCATHFIGMSAASPRFDPAAPLPGDEFNVTLVAALVANVALVIVGLSVAATWVSLRDRIKLVDEEKRLRDLADIAVEGLLICDGERIVGANRSVEALLGCDRELLIGRHLTDVVTGVRATDVPRQTEAEAQIDLAGASVPVRVISQTLVIGGRDHKVVAVRDQRERLRNEAEMIRLAHHDSLTGLANRLTFSGALAGLYASRRDDDADFALITLDLDRFKWVNDTLGHGVGDELLRRVAGRLSKAVGDGDLVARLGGDEFSILAARASDLASVSAIAERVIDLLGRPFMIDGKVIEVSASVGVAMGPADGSGPDALSGAADLALYQAKQQGGDSYRLFEPAMNARAQLRRSLELDLRRAVGREEFSVHYQPQVDAATGAFEGAEALVRWRHAERGMVAPCDFIPLAEEIGLINQIGEWVLRTACAEAATWPDHLSIAVNLSPLQLRDARLVSTVAAVLAETGLAAHRLELEVTESALIQDETAALSVLTGLQELGARVSMDDFGTGYSSLSHLRRFPFNKIKIDQSFVRQLPHDRDSAAIVQAIVGLAGKLGLSVTAEGVETEEQRAFTADEGCGQIQGYLIARPMPAEEISALFLAPSTVLTNVA